MNNLFLPFSPSRRPVAGQLGMTLLDSLVAMIMLVVFTGIVALVLQFTLRFFSVAESGEQNEFEVSNGVLIDHQQIQMAMDDLVEVLSQPGITLERLKGQERCSVDDPPSSCVACTDNFDESCRPQIAFDLTTDPQVACPAARPVSHWGLPMPEVSLPPGYRLCLWKTAVEVVDETTGVVTTKAVESSIAQLHLGAQPGIYLLQALPEQLSSTSLPTRRLFCRPRPFC